MDSLLGPFHRRRAQNYCLHHVFMIAFLGNVPLYSCFLAFSFANDNQTFFYISYIVSPYIFLGEIRKGAIGNCSPQNCWMYMWGERLFAVDIYLSYDTYIWLNFFRWSSLVYNLQQPHNCISIFLLYMICYRIKIHASDNFDPPDPNLVSSLYAASRVIMVGGGLVGILTWIFSGVFICSIYDFNVNI